MVKTNFLVLIFLSTLLQGCSVLLGGGYDELRLKRKDYLGNNLKTAGYYYGFSNSPPSTAAIIFLFNNGIFLYHSSIDANTVEDLDNYFKTRYRPTSPDFREAWGVFQVENDQIKIERWLDGPGKLPTGLSQGKILNDSTLYLINILDSHTWRFRNLNPKPDSTNANKFIK